MRKRKRERQRERQREREREEAVAKLKNFVVAKNLSPLFSA
jgi:hypothetical protein